MTPLYFGSPDRRLFGIYEPGRASGRSPRAAVLCNPWGQEYIRAHRSLRRLAQMLAAAGRDALRFDYFGTGDSSGDMVDADLAGWEQDIETAIDEARDTSGAPSVTLVGLRLGAALAARVAARRTSDVEAIVLWDPIVSGVQYLQELRATAASIDPSQHLPRSSESGGGHEILGFPLTAAQTADIATLDLRPQIAGLPARMLVLVSQLSAAHDEFAVAVRGRSDHSTFEHIASLPAWLEDRDTGAGAIPVKSLQRIVTWLA